ncbi:MAG TPA: aminomethyl-transferring glycine dehydrogenase subunit GcvPB [Candidatus Limnocylindria bacterium]|jgi:glycine dehydrogenase subunit 2|nr:aminomethyl-transferring glycine dehydrogenase subunit GcvPB [Candidatus Limnocylindria bacterium]
MSAVDSRHVADASGRGAAFQSPVAGSAPRVVEPTLFERSRPGRRAVRFPPPSDAAQASADSQPPVPAAARRSAPPRLPEVNELELVRHFNRLSRLNHAIDIDFYPLGSCTMKYNPKINEWAARLPGLAGSHPLDPAALSQGSLELQWLLAELLAEIGGFAAVSLQPAAGAHGELTGMLMTRAFHRSRGEGDQRRVVIVPDSAHGTNPATATMVGFTTRTVRSNAHGGIDLEALRAALGPDTAALMLTNPSTLGIFEDQIDEVLAAVHEAGAIAYMDGANLNAILGRFRAGDAGFDIMHFNLHKTFSTPHGGGGPGAGPVGVSARMAPFLPAQLPRLVAGDRSAVLANAWAGRPNPDARFELEAAGERPTAIGQVRTFGGNFGMHVRAYAYIRANGDAGLRQVTDDAVLAANYLRVGLADAYDLPFDRICKHEVVFSARRQKREHGVSALDVAKAILDHGIHPPTIYFPLIVDEALMIEPTETETRETLDRFVDVMHDIAERVKADPDSIRAAPTTTPVGRLDEATAARQPDLRWPFPDADRTPSAGNG